MKLTLPEEEWHEWFAWHPVHLDFTPHNEYVWWQKVQRYYSRRWGFYIYRKLE